jgi:hypothetical protein
MAVKKVKKNKIVKKKPVKKTVKKKVIKKAKPAKFKKVLSVEKKVDKDLDVADEKPVEKVPEPKEEVTDEELNNFFDDEYPEDTDYEKYPKGGTEEEKPEKEVLNDE